MRILILDSTLGVVRFRYRLKHVDISKRVIDCRSGYTPPASPTDLEA